MKKLLLSALPVLLLCANLCAGSSKIAVVDLEKVFKEYYKSRIAEDMIRRQAEMYRSHLNNLANELKTAQEKASNARADALNIGLSSNERAKAEQTAAEAMKKVAEKRAEIELYRSGRARDIRKLEAGQRAAIMADIRNELKKRAASGGYSYVFDSSGKTVNDQPALLIYPESHDITREVISNLNLRSTVKNRKGK